jgi:hypothetical protein
MSQLRIGLVGVLTALALSGVGAPAALAKIGGITPTSETFSLSGGKQLLESTIATQKILIRCEAEKGSATLTIATASGPTELTLSTCTVWTINSISHAAEQATACTVANPVIKATLTLEAAGLAKFTSVSSEIKITGASCPLKGTYKLSGEQICGLPEAEVALVTHSILCNAVGSKLLLGAEALRYTGELSITPSGANVGKTWWVE